MTATKPKYYTCRKRERRMLSFVIDTENSSLRKQTLIVRGDVWSAKKVLFTQAMKTQKTSFFPRCTKDETK